MLGLGSGLASFTFIGDSFALDGETRPVLVRDPPALFGV